MKFILDRLENVYLNPSGNEFLFFVFLNKNKWFFMFLLFFIFLCYPLNVCVNHYAKFNEVVRLIDESEGKLFSLRKEYQDLNEKESAVSKEYNLTYLNSQIQKIAKHTNVELQHIQWQLEQDKNVEITLISHSENLFNFILEVNKIPYLKFNTLIFNKSEQEGKVGLNMILVLTKNRG